MVKIAGTKIKGFRLDKNGKLVKSQKGKSVSRRIAERNRPKVTYKRGK